MSERQKLGQLRMISQLMLDIRLVALEKAARARQASLDHLAELDRPQPPTDLDAIVAGEVGMRYQLWADQRRSAINMELARQTVEWTEAQQQAAQAFGRAEVLGKIAARQKKTPR